MTVTPKDKTIHTLLKEKLTRENNKVEPFRFFVPKYQRKYVWQKDKWEALFDDLKDNNGHFLGTLVLLPIQENGNQESSKFEIIDGQQRLASISLLLTAITNRMRELYDIYTTSSSDPENDTGMYYGVKKSIEEVLFATTKPNIILKLELSKINNNDKDFHYVVSTRYNERTKINPPKNFANRQIFKCYQYFRDQIKNYSMEELFSITDNVLSAISVCIYPGAGSNPYLIFETLNNRGQPLTVADILKNKIFAKLDNATVRIDEIDEEWKQYIENLGSNIEIDNFFRHFYFANKCYYDEKIFKTEKRPKKATKANIVEIYDNLIKNDVQGLWKGLLDQSNSYSFFINPQKTDNSKNKESLSEDLLNLSYISAIPSYSLLLYLKNRGMPDEDLSKVIRYLIKFFTRRHVCDKPKVKELDDIFINVIEKCHNHIINAEYIINKISNESKGKSAEDREFKEALESDIYLINHKATKFLLVQLEEYENPTIDEISSFWFKDDKNKPYWTIEHILPKGGEKEGKIPESWENELRGEKQEEENLVDKRNSLTHKIGNLTLTRYNAQLGLKDFSEKKKGLQKGLMINTNILNKEKWGEKEITSRTQELVEKLMILFNLENENN